MRRTTQVLIGFRPAVEFSLPLRLLHRLFQLLVVSLLLASGATVAIAQSTTADVPLQKGVPFQKGVSAPVTVPSPGRTSAPGVTIVPGGSGVAQGNPLPRGKPKIEHVFLFIVDGLRMAESFDSADHKLIPNIWNNLVPLGTIYRNFFNLGYTQTTAAHATITSGVSQTMALTYLQNYDLKRVQEEPSFLQVYRGWTGLPKDKVWLINGKADMIRYVGQSLHPLFGADNEPSVAFIGQWPYDDTVDDVTKLVIDTYHPSLTVVNFKDTDGAGHSGVWSNYTSAIESVDQIVYDLYQKIVSDPVYKDSTAVILVADHGRHTEGLHGTVPGFTNHGCSCMGCREVPFLAIGPGIRKNTVIEQDGYLRDIAPTIAAMLGFPFRYSEGRVLREIFEASLPPEPAEDIHPAIAFADGKIHIAFTTVEDSKSHVVYSRSADNGVTWTQPQIVSLAPNNINPRIAVEGDLVALSWCTYTMDGFLRVTVRESLDGGDTWGSDVQVSGAFEYKGCYASDLCYRQGEIDIVWEEPVPKTSFKKSALGAITVRDKQIVAVDAFNDLRMRHTRCATSSVGTGVVYQKLSFTNVSWDTWFCLYDANGWGAPVQICNTLGESIHPDIVADDSGFHVAWAERIAGIFRILYRHSSDGVTWDAPQIIGHSGVGAWRPQITVNGGVIAVLWEGYEHEIPALYGAMSYNGGANWTSPRRFTAVQFEVRPAAVLDPTGRLHFIYQKGNTPTVIRYQNAQL